jgi:hypothetical protein
MESDVVLGTWIKPQDSGIGFKRSLQYVTLSWATVKAIQRLTPPGIQLNAAAADLLLLLFVIGIAFALLVVVLP